jgi:short-subunit dehydrogenase
MHDHPYTIITGASQGFGKSLALECAERNWPLILVSLPGDDLHQLAEYIRMNYNIPVLYFGYDLSRKEDCLAFYEAILEKKISVNILINNAGVGGTHLFEERDPGFYQQQIALNVLAPTILSHLFLPLLKKHAISHILNVSSMAGLFSLPGKQVYGGTKSYLLSFSKSLRRELKMKNVSVSVICPGGMNTTLSLIVQNRRLTGMSRWSIMDPEEVATIAINGMLEGKEVIIPGGWNRFFIFLDKIIPPGIKDYLLNQQVMKKARLATLYLPGRLPV